MASERISVRLDEQCREQFDDLVRESGQSESQVVREAIDLLYQARRKKRTKVVAQPGSVLEVLQRAGLIGCAKGLPHDLSTNRKHMEGFGGSKRSGSRRRRAARRSA